MIDPKRIAGFMCTAGMFLGLAVDLSRSPTGTIAAFCSGGADPAQRIAAHATMMPFAHAGMMAGFILCVPWHACWRRSERWTLPVLVAAQLAQMAVAESGALWLAGDGAPLVSMAMMGGLMLASDGVILAQAMKGAARSALHRRNRRHRDRLADERRTPFGKRCVFAVGERHEQPLSDPAHAALQDTGIGMTLCRFARLELSGGGRARLHCERRSLRHAL